ncbi:hypothetical protein OROGR_024787 [Orobanche gracilis]
MENSSINKAAEGVKYWLQWQVVVCALIFILPTAIAIRILRQKVDLVVPVDLWATCWRNLHPRWLLIYRAFAFLAMALLLYDTVAAFGFFVFFFYTQWTCSLVMVYFALATIVSVRGCRIHVSEHSPTREKDKFLKYGTELASKERESKGFVKLEQVNYNPIPIEELGFMCAGAVVLTDIVFWCLLLPFMTDENFQLTLMIGCMHSVNAVVLIIESALNRLVKPFSWFGLVYFVMWSCVYVVFQWVLHACCFTWWPYPFLDLSTPWVPGFGFVSYSLLWAVCIAYKIKTCGFVEIVSSNICEARLEFCNFKIRA